MSESDDNEADDGAAGYEEVSTISEGSYVGAYERLQSIKAEYYNITDAESWPIAGLLVLLDGKRQAVRAELHLYEDLHDPVREAAIRQGRLLLENRYYSADPVALRIMKSYQWRDTFHVQANGALTIAPEPVWFKRWQTVAAMGATVLLIFIIWALASLFRSTPGTVTTSTPATSTPITQTVAVSSEVSSSAVATVTVQEFATYPQTNNLPTSTRANADLKIGQRVRVASGLALTLRSAPGADAGSQMGFLKEQEEATIVNGPVWTPGESDTIVWWLVSLDNGTKAWAPANTSTLTLLEPVS